MKIYVAFLILLLSLGNVQAQDLIWNTEVHHDDVQLRQPLATVLGQLDIDIPSDGKVIVRFDGYCKSSPGDRIIVAASNINNWESNDGNLGLYAYALDQNSQSFSHQRFYNVTSGKHSFYAIGQNFVDTDGSGIASIHGTLTVEYFPNTSHNLFFEGQGILKYPVILNENAQVISSKKMEIPSKGSVLVNIASSVYSLSNNEIELALSDSEIWPMNDITSKVNIVNTYATRFITTSKIFEVEEGSHEFFILARKNKGDFTNSNNAFYANMMIQFFPAEGEKNLLVSDIAASVKISMETLPTALGKVSVNAPHAGKVILNASGKFNIDIQESLLFKISNQPIAEISDPDLKVQKLHIDHGDEYFSTTRVYQVEKGNNDFYFYGAYKNVVPAMNEGTVTANFTLKYVAEPNISSINQIELNTANFNFFPNPASAILFINCNTNFLEKPIDVYLYDMNGNIVKNKINETQKFIEMSDLDDGVYILKLVSKELTVSQKIIKKSK